MPKTPRRLSLSASRPKSVPPVNASHRELTTKRRGELAELAFILKAASYGFGVAKPFGDSERYDVIVDSRQLVPTSKTQCRPECPIRKAAQNRKAAKACVGADVACPEHVEGSAPRAKRGGVSSNFRSAGAPLLPGFGRSRDVTSDSRTAGSLTLRGFRRLRSAASDTIHTCPALNRTAPIPPGCPPDPTPPLWRVQIKCSTHMIEGLYRLNAQRRTRGRAVPYFPGEIDFLAAYIIPEDTWYIIPLEAFLGCTGLLFRRPQRPPARLI